MKKGRRIIQCLAVLILISGLVVLLFPHISQWLYTQKVDNLATSFESAITEKQDTRLDELYQFMVKENERLNQEGQKDLVDPFSYEQPAIDLTQYGIEDNLVGFISIPDIDETLPIYLGANEENMKKGAVHMTQTSYPVGGTNTNSVIAAHRGYSQATMFRHIDRLQTGNIVYIRNFHELLEYRVTEIKIISPDESNEILIQPQRDMLTLMSCHPYRQNKQRYLVYCERTNTSPASQQID